MFRGRRGAFRGVEYVRVQSVHDEAALLLVENDAGVAQHAKMMRDVDDLRLQQTR